MAQRSSPTATIKSASRRARRNPPGSPCRGSSRLPSPDLSPIIRTLYVLSRGRVKTASTITDQTTLGLYLSVPFCRAKCTFCNFASDVFAPSRMDGYVARLRSEIRSAPASALNAHLPSTVDTVYFGGGTPSLLSPSHLRDLFTDLRQTFDLSPAAEITLEAAPGQIADATLDELLRQGVNRISLGIQSFVDRETYAVGRLHTAEACRAEIARLQSRGVTDISLDLIAGLPFQTEGSWRHSLAAAVATGAPHLSIYMLEIDEDSRLGDELLLGGRRYHAEAVPTDDQSAGFYEIACDTLSAAGLAQYEISNFARPGHPSRHNLKYWHRQPYLGLGLDAHSMLLTPTGALRFANTDSMDLYLRRTIPATQNLVISTQGERPARTSFSTPAQPDPTPPQSREEIHLINQEAALEEALFLGLRLNAGVSLQALAAEFSSSILNRIQPALAESVSYGLLEQAGDRLRLTPRGRLISNEVFSRLLLPDAA